MMNNNKATTFDSPGDIKIRQDRFDIREVGLTHPDNDSFIRIRNNGDIEFSTGEGVSIVMHAATRSVTINADSINFQTRDSGLKWNNHFFNSKATYFGEPTFVEVHEQDVKSIYRGVDYYVDPNDVPSKLRFTNPLTGEQVTIDEYTSRSDESRSDQNVLVDPETNLRPNSLREI